MTVSSNPEKSYVLATGEEAARRLQIVNAVHGPDSEALLHRAGLIPGMHIADIGCGVGVLSCWMAQQSRPGGDVVGVDISPEQIEEARKRAHAEGVSEQTRFIAAPGANTGLPNDSFDFVYSRFMLMHIADPVDALREMKRILKPGGILAVEDGDFESPFCWPESAEYDRCFEIYRTAGARHGANFQIGRTLYQHVLELGFQNVDAQLVQPLLVEGEVKRLPEWTLEEGADQFIQLGVSTREEIDRLLARLSQLAQEKSYLFGMTRMTQVIARK